MSFTSAEKLRELELELHYRERVFARLVAEGRMAQKTADRRMAIMREMAQDYAAQAERDQPRLIG